MKLGDCVRDRITGYEGIATGVAHYITGCTQWLIASPQLKPDGDTISHWFDEVRLEPGSKPAISLTPAAGQPGGPSLGPSRAVQSPPTR